MCFDVVFLYENIRTCLFTHVYMYFLHLVLTFIPHYIIMVKGPFVQMTSRTDGKCIDIASTRMVEMKSSTE